MSTHGFARLVLQATLLTALLGASANVFSQTATIATVPVIVNVDAIVAITPPEGLFGAIGDAAVVEANKEATLTITLKGGTFVSHTAQMRGLSAPAAVSHSHGNVLLRLSPQQYGSAEIALYTVSGKRILSGRGSASQASLKISRSNMAPGVYLLSVKGVDGNSYQTKLNHRGGRLNVNVMFGHENAIVAAPALAKMSAEANGDDALWTMFVVPITSGYHDTSYTFTPLAVENLRQTITLNPIMLTVGVSSDGIGALGGGDYAEGDTVNINAGTAPAGLRFANWTTTNSGVTFDDVNSATTSFIMPANGVTVTANFVPIIYKVTVSSIGIGAFGGGDYAKGDTVNVNAGTAPEGLRFAYWTKSSLDVIFFRAASSVDSFIMIAQNVSVTAVFSQTSMLTVNRNPVAGGSVTVNDSAYKGPTTHNINTSVTVRATPNSGYVFMAWSGASSSTNSEITVTMSDNRVLTANFQLVGAIGTFTDSRDGQTYRTVVTPDGKTWMAENLNYQTTGSWCYDNISSNCNTYGRLYTWDGTRTACPSGWRLPTRGEWGSLAIAAGGTGAFGADGTAGTALKAQSPAYNGTDNFGFSALPGGIGLLDGSFLEVGSSGNWWTGTEDGGDLAYGRGVHAGYENMWESWNDKRRVFSVRCVMN